MRRGKSCKVAAKGEKKREGMDVLKGCQMAAEREVQKGEEGMGM